MFLAFGEVMLRVAPEGHLRFRQALPGRVDVTFGGGEANVCASLAMYGCPVRYVTALPAHAPAQCIVDNLRGLGVDTSHVLWRKEGRLGIYFVEKGANQRGSTVVYDRDHSAAALAGPDEYNFPAALDGVRHVHVTGITPAISEQGFLATLRLVELAQEGGCTVSCDLNYRKKLWNWRPGTPQQKLAGECMEQILRHVNLVIGNEEDAADVLGIHAHGTNVSAGQIDSAAYEQVAREIAGRFKQVTGVAITLRESVSADHNNWGAMLFDEQSNQAYFSPLDADGNYSPHPIRDIIDRVGAGDSFGAGLLCALASDDFNQPQQAIDFAVAASCLKHSIQGDFNYVTKSEVAALVAGNATGRVQR